MNLFRQNSIVKYLASGLLVFAFFTISVGPTPHIPRAEAQDAVVVVGGNGTWQETVAAGAAVVSSAFDSISSAALASLALKEWTLDRIAFALLNIMIQHITRSIVEWINSGFQGSPSFVTDLKGFLLDVADIEAGRFLTELGLGFMCSPFKLDVQLALAFQYQTGRDYEYQCRLSDIVNNIDNFINGNNFYEGGWDGWFSMTLEPQNNPYGNLVSAQSRFALSVRNAQDEEIKLLDFGEGFFSFEMCEDDPNPDPDATSEDFCTITTPGKVIEDQLNRNLDSGRQRLIIADEINEIIGALFAQLVKQIFTGTAGLLGLTQSGYTAEGFSYLEAATAPGSGDTVGYDIDLENPILNSILDAEDYLALQEEAVSRINNAQLYPQNSWPNCPAPGLPNSLTAAREDALAEISTTNALISDLEFLNEAYLATDDPHEQLDIMQEYILMRSTGLLVTQVDVVIFENNVLGNSYLGLIADIQSYQSTVNSFCSAWQLANDE